MSADCSFFSRRSLSAGPSKPVCWDAQRTDSLLRPDIATHLRGYAAAAGAAGAGRGRRAGCAMAASAPGIPGVMRGLGQAQGARSLQWHQAVHRMGRRHQKKPPSPLRVVRRALTAALDGTI